MGYWEGAGQVAGIWLGATMALATLPVVAIDGPLPIADAAWLMANARNTDSLRRRGGRLGKQLDQYLEDDAPTSAMNENLAVISPEPGSNQGPLAISTGAKIGGASSFDSFLKFDNLLTYDFSNIDFVQPTYTVQDLTYINRNSQWPEWND